MKIVGIVLFVLAILAVAYGVMVGPSAGGGVAGSSQSQPAPQKSGLEGL
jgi:hypothetical protein